MDRATFIGTARELDEAKDDDDGDGTNGGGSFLWSV
jgi:hypothetical protein